MGAVVNGSGPTDNLAPFLNEGVEGYHTFLPKQQRRVGQLLPVSKFPQNASPPKLFEPLTIRGVEFVNRAWVAPMCQYSSDYGHATDHHFVHTGSMAMRGWGNIIIEATAVLPEGRISPEDAGLWQDSQIEPLKRQADYVHALGGTIGIQLAHAGRKASTLAPWVQRKAQDEGWEGGLTSTKEVRGWPDEVFAPSALSFKPGSYPNPKEASSEYIVKLKQAFVDAAERCKKIGFDFIEIHGAHGYMIHEFLDPLSNKRTDQYGGSFDNRARIAVETTEAIRAVWDKPLFFRVSASDWLDEPLGPEKNANGEWAWWGIEQSTMLAQKLQQAGIDLYDVSSGGNDMRQNIKVGPGYQVHFAKAIKEKIPDLLVGTVGIITDPVQANDILQDEGLDVVLCARQVLRDIDFPLQAAETLGCSVAPAVQYERAWSRMVVKREHLKAAAHHKGCSEVEGEEGRELERRKSKGVGSPVLPHQSIP